MNLDEINNQLEKIEQMLDGIDLTNVKGKIEC